MNTTVYLIRHGDIECADRIPGRMTGMHLSDHGKKQARNLIEFFKDRDLDAIYSSPMDRAVETASVLAEEKKLQIQICDAFNEIDFGDWTNKRFSELESDFGWKQFHFFRNGTVIPDGELMIEVQSRMISQLQLLKETHEGQSFAVFSHNDPIKSVIAFYSGISLDLFLRITIDTGSVSVLQFDNESCEISKINIIGDFQAYWERA
ncbi:MAG: histidine phosphatase family protein [Fibrobacter sp.]|nr:histidine phosphatase family protein [Fibrobacter sp.]